MRIITEVKQEEKPLEILVLSPNSYYYNFDIKPCQIEKSELGDKISGYSFKPIYIKGTPNYKDCVRHVIRAFYSQEEEFDLINSYNNSLLNKLKSSEGIIKYKEYLTLLDRIKSQIKKSFNYGSN